MQIDAENIMHRGFLGKWYVNATQDFQDCTAFASSSWVTRGVRLKRHRGPGLVITKYKDPFAYLDPTYDGLDLMADTAWLISLSKAVSAASGLPFRTDKNLR